MCPWLSTPPIPTARQSGILVFRDLTPPAQPPVTQAQAVLAPIGGGNTKANVQISVNGKRLRVVSFPTGVLGQSAGIVIPTTVGIEFQSCAVNTSTAIAVCGEDLLGDPMIGSIATLTVDGAAVASGPITVPAS
jgi:hypothetical protein